MVKTKKIVIWIIVAVLVIGIAIGSFFLFNSNEWRFRMGAFVGKYNPQYIFPDGTAMMSFLIRTRKSSTGWTAGKGGRLTALYEDGYECWDLLDENKKNQYAFEFDPAVRDAISDVLRLAQSNTRIHRNSIEFTDAEESFAITKTAYGTIDYRPFNYVRYIDLDVTNTVYERVLCEAHTGYWDKTNPIGIVSRPGLDHIINIIQTVKGSDGTDYKIQFTLYYK